MVKEYLKQEGRIPGFWRAELKQTCAEGTQGLEGFPEWMGYKKASQLSAALTWMRGRSGYLS